MISAYVTQDQEIACRIYRGLYDVGQPRAAAVVRHVRSTLERLGWTVYERSAEQLSCYRGATRLVVEYAHRTPAIEQVRRLAQESCDARVIVVTAPTATVPLELEGRVWMVGLAVRP